MLLREWFSTSREGLNQRFMVERYGILIIAHSGVRRIRLLGEGVGYHKYIIHNTHIEVLNVYCSYSHRRLFYLYVFMSVKKITIFWYE